MKLTFRLSLLLLLSICLSLPINAASYYFSTSIGDDSRSATQAQNPNTPWKTIRKLNEFFRSLAPGDEILFRKGEIYFGSIHMTASGTDSSPIKISAYGTGENPIITSFVKVDGWQSTGQGRYRSTNVISAKAVKVVTIDGKIQEMGRFPNTDASNGGFLRISTVPGSGYISSTELSSSANFTNAEVVIRKVLWVTDRHKITSHTGSDIQFTTTPIDHLGDTFFNPSKGWGFFIQNHLETLDTFGEWFYDEQDSKVSVHFGNINPTNHIVEVSTLNNLLTKTSTTSNIIVDNISFKGANKDAIYLETGRNIKIQNSSIEYVGETGIQALGINGIEVSNSIIKDVLSNGIILRNGNNSIKLLKNRLENIAIFAGGMRSGNNNGNGIVIQDSNALVEYNEVINTGYNGISFRRNNTKISNNLIVGYCIHKTDGGGIYSFGGASGTEVFTNREISNNIVLDAKGTNFGTPFFASLEHINRPAQTSGIFLDDNVNNILVENNTMAHSPYSGIKISNATKLIIRNNTFYDNANNISINNFARGVDTRELQITGNIVFSKNSNQNFYTLRSEKDDIKDFGIFNNNFFVNPLGDNYRISVGIKNSTGQIFREYSPETWKNTFGKDTESNTSTLKFPEFLFKNNLGDNLYKTGDFEGNLVGVSCTSCSASRVANTINGGTLQVITSALNDIKSTRIATAAVEKGKNYILKFKAKANRPGVIKTFLRFSSNPWQPISKSSTVELNTELREYSILFTPIISLTNPVIVMENVESNWTFWIDDLVIQEADVALADSKNLFLFEYNDTNAIKTIPLTTEFINVKDRTYSNSIDLEPYTSIAFISKSGEIPIVNSNPILKISRIDPNTPLIERNDVKFEAEITSSTGIQKVDYYANDKVIGTSTSSPYSFIWENVPKGNHLITANATDIVGKNGWSQEITIEVASLVTETNDDVVIPPGSIVGGNAFEKYINTGSVETVSFDGIVFDGETQGNQFFNTSSTFTFESDAVNPIFQTERFSKNLAYSIPIPNGRYTIKTLHNENWFGKNGPKSQAGQRVFDISIEGQKVKENFDLFLYNNNTPTILTFPDINIEDGTLNLDLLAKINNATLSGIVILKTNLSPQIEYHINIGSPTNTSYNGITFVGEGFIGETILNSNITRNELASTDELFKKERWGKNIKLTLPLPNGKYRIVTYHTELWFGFSNLETRENQRVFDIRLEGILVKENFDLKKENNNKQMSLVFNNIIVSDNQLDLDLIAKINNATISGISIISETTQVPDFNFFLNTGGTADEFYNGVKFIDENTACKCFNIDSRTYRNPSASTEPIFQKERFNKNLKYNVNLPNGTYTVYTFHNELWFGKGGPRAQIGSRVFDVKIENELVKSNFDIFSENNNNPTILRFNNVEVTDGTMNFEFTGKINNATVSAIAIVNNTTNAFARTTTNTNTSFDHLFSVNESNTSITMNESTMRIYPNPVKDIVNIELTNASSIDLISLYDVNGRLINTINSSEILSGRTLKMDLSGTKPGVYILNVIGTNPIHMYKHRILKIN